MSAVAALPEALLSLPPVAALAAPWRQALEQAAGPEPLSDAALAGLAGLADTLGSLARLNADGDVVLAAILNDLPAWRARIEPQLAKQWPTVATLLEGQRAAAQVWTLHAADAGGRNAEGLRRLLLVMVRDLRVVPVLLARQLAQMRTAGKRPEAERRALAQLTRDIHAPLANRLGIWQLKWELEDLAFRHLDPDSYQGIARWLDEKRGDRERYIEQVKRDLGEALKAQGLEAEVAGRPKHITSIWKKMQKKAVPIGELYDLRAVRVLVKDVPACYAALGAVHALWTPIPSEFDDYIARPKRNDYRSLHTAVVGPEGKTLEVQIRTHEMHAQAELGVAAHWRYKEGRSAPADAGLDRKIEWMRRLLDSGREEPGREDAGSDESLRKAFDSELVEDRIYTLTPQGDVVDLPVGATPLDFAYHVHTMVGHRCRGAKVDGRIVPLDYRLRSGERVEILTAKTAEPRRDWLVAANGFLASGRSRDKVRAWFHKLDRVRNVQAGRELLEKELRRLSLLQADLAPMLAKFHVDTVDDLYVLVALGDAGPHQVGRALLDHERGRQEASESSRDAQRGELARAPPKLPRTASGGSAFTVVGLGNLLMQIARCCHPLPGEAIVGYLTQGRGVSVHRADCAAFLRLSANQPQRVLSVEWGRVAGGHTVNVQVDAVDRRWLLKDLTNLIAQDDAHVLSIHSDTLEGSRVRLRMQLRVRDHEQLSRLLGRIDSLSGVEQVRRG